MYYEEQVRDGVLCYRSTPGGEWVPMSAERLTGMLLEDFAQVWDQIEHDLGFNEHNMRTTGSRKP